MKSLSSILRTRADNFKQLQQGLILRLYSTAVDEVIEIPNYIPRGPTDILRALETTINIDPTSSHYKYHDDPYLIPMSNIGKRAFAMAQEAGRKAAFWVHQQHPELFQHREADPPINAFFPKAIYNEKSEVTEQDLKKTINDVLVSSAITVYKLCKEKNTEVSNETMQSLLELLCFYNNEDTLPEEFIEERWFRQSSKLREKHRKTWKDGALAEEIFISIDNPSSNAYSALIQGMGKYYQVDRAWQLFEEAQQKEIVLSVEAYNSIIRVSNFLKESYEMRWNFIMEMLQLMKAAKVSPNLNTLNAVLETLSTMGISKNTKNLVLQTLAEFKKLGIEPALSSWYFVLVAYCKERGPVSTVLHDIMTYIENKEHKIQNINDTFFFVTAMEICRNHLHDRDLAKRVDKLLHFGNNYDLIGNSYRESIYYRHYFILLSATEPLEEFMENTYFKLVPHIYVPEPAVMGEILKVVEINGATEYLPKLWSDMMIFDHTSRENLLHLVLNIMINNPPKPDSNLVQNFPNIAWDIYCKIENETPDRVNKLSFTGDMLGNIMTVLLHANDFEKASVVMDRLDKGHHNVLGVPNLKALSLFLDHCIEQKAPSKAITCVQYCSDSGFEEAKEMAVRLNKALTLDETHLNKLGNIVGSFGLESLKDKESIS